MLNYKIKGEIKNKKALFKKFQGMPVDYIDGLPTAIKSTHKNFKKGFIIADNLSKKPCFVASFSNYFAHGRTLKEALETAKNKYWISKNTEERLIAFEKIFDKNKKYKNSEFFKWHNILTGSCLAGRESFCQNNNISLDDESTPLEFIELCKNDFGGDIIKQLYKKRSGYGSGDGDGDGSGDGYGSGYGD